MLNLKGKKKPVQNVPSPEEKAMIMAMIDEGRDEKYDGSRGMISVFIAGTIDRMRANPGLLGSQKQYGGTDGKEAQTVQELPQGGI